MAVPSSVLWRLCLTKIMPAGFLLGAGMECFMYYTGFWNTALRKASEREEESREALQGLQAAAAARQQLK